MAVWQYGYQKGIGVFAAVIAFCNEGNGIGSCLGICFSVGEGVDVIVGAVAKVPVVFRYPAEAVEFGAVEEIEAVAVEALGGHVC